jgi:hypothetical protein
MSMQTLRREPEQRRQNETNQLNMQPALQMDSEGQKQPPQRPSQSSELPIDPINGSMRQRASSTGGVGVVGAGNLRNGRTQPPFLRSSVAVGRAQPQILRSRQPSILQSASKGGQPFRGRAMSEGSAVFGKISSGTARHPTPGVQPSLPSRPPDVLHVEVDRDHDGKLGLAFVGPADHDPVRDGVYVANLQPGCPAALEGLLLPGMRVLSINNRNVTRCTKSTVSVPRPCRVLLFQRAAVVMPVGACVARMWGCWCCTHREK